VENTENQRGQHEESLEGKEVMDSRRPDNPIVVLTRQSEIPAVC